MLASLNKNFSVGHRSLGTKCHITDRASSAIAKGVMLSAMPLAVADLTKSRREILIVPRLYPLRLAQCARASKQRP
jgi:hypothetical protein